MHWYARAVGVIPRAHALPHPKWWHISLQVRPDGLVTHTMPLAGGGIFYLKMDLLEHAVHLVTSQGTVRSLSMRAGLSASVFGEQLIRMVADLGLEGDYLRQKFADHEERPYDAQQAVDFFRVLIFVSQVFERQRAWLLRETDGYEPGPVQLWPHGFDLAFEWFGTRQVEHAQGDSLTRLPAQINLGFSPGDSSFADPYFYSNPWPFETEHLLDKPLPAGARWFTDGWQGSLLPYTELAGDPDAEGRLLDYARAVFKICAPTLAKEWNQPKPG